MFSSKVPKMGKNTKTHKKSNCDNKNAHQNETIKVQVKSDMQSFVESTTATLNSLQSSTMTSSEELANVKRDVLSLKSEVDKFINKFIGLELQLAKYSETIALQNAKQIENYENLHPSPTFEKPKNRNRNIVIHLTEEWDPEIIVEENKVKDATDFFSNDLGITVTVEKVVPLSNNKSMLVTLGSTSDKKMIFKNCHKLKDCDSPISIVEDLCKEDRVKRKQLLPVLMMEKRKGNKVYFRGAELFINGVKWEKIEKDDDVTCFYSPPITPNENAIHPPPHEFRLPNNKIKDMTKKELMDFIWHLELTEGKGHAPMAYLRRLREQLDSLY